MEGELLAKISLIEFDFVKLKHSQEVLLGKTQLFSFVIDLSEKHMPDFDLLEFKIL